QGRILFVNRQIERLSGYSRDELLGDRVETLVPARLRRTHEANRDSYVAHAATRPMGSNLDIKFRRKDGSEFPADIALSPLRGDDGMRVVASIRDITERHRSRARLEAVLQISESILRGQETADVLKLVAISARQLAEAALATIAVPAADDRLVI